MAKGKTYKREVATVQLVLHWALVTSICYVAFTEPNRDLTDLVTLATGLAVWVYGFAAAAFGLDAFSKQITPAQQAPLTPPSKDQDIFDE